MPATKITHSGIVDSISDDCVRVRILQSAACGSCAAAKLCRSSEQKEKVIDVVDADASHYAVGQEVTIVGTVSQGLRATLWAYVLPLVLMIIVMMVASLSGLSDGFVALSALSVLVVYYVVLYFFRRRMEQTFAFRLDLRGENNRLTEN